MKKIFAALTAVTIAVGLSLATAVAPASADDGTTPTATPTPVASSTPPATPTDPAPTPNVTPTAPVVPAVMTAVTADTTFTVVSNNTQVHKAFVCKYVGTPGVNERLQTGQNPIDVDTHSIAESPVVVGSYFNDAQGRSYVLALDTGQPDPSVSSCPNPTPTYETVVWSMPSPFDGSDATYPQVGVTQYKGETTEDLDVAVPTTCGTQYQVDVYAQTFGSTNNTSAIDALFASGLAGPNGAQDGSYLAGAGNNPGVYGLGHAWKFVQNATCPPPCIPDSQVSYTYSNDLSNSGDITVPTVQGSSGQLCEPFYVTATSWKYTTNAVWPQVIDQVDHVNGPPSGGNNIKISASGTYHYAAPVTCGQGDIYASFTSNDATLFPENDGLPGIGYLNGPSNPFSEHFLSDMGFHGPNPTYIQGQTSCWKPIQETGWPTTSTLSCTQGSSNSLSLPVVPGGEWTVSNGNHNYSYNKTYPMGTGVTNWVPTNFTGSYTITLTDGSSTDSYQVTGTTSHWTPQNPRTLDCNTVITPTKPTVNPIDQCGVDGSVTIPNTPGVIYEHNGRVVSGTITGLHGSYSVTATAASGYEFSVGATSHWTFQLGSELKDCTVTQVLGSCTASNSDSTKSVSLKLDNASSSVSSSFEVKIEGTSYDQTFVVNAHTTSTVSINNATTAGETIDVYINGSNRATQICILPFPGCVVTNVPADPSHTDISCTGNNTVLGSITVDGNPELTYTLHLPGGSTEVFPSGQPSTISGLVAGNYSVTVVANPGFVLGGSGSFPATVTILNAVDCIGTELTPVVSSVTPSCAPNPVNITSSQFNAALAEVQGTITIPSDANMTFTINNGSTTVPITAGTYIEPDGTYTVVATLTSTAIADGFTFGPSTGYTLSTGDTVATFTPIGFTAGCLPTLASWHSGATGTPAVCTLTGGQSGTITLVHGSSSADLTDEAGKVTYTLKNLSNNATTNLGSTALTVKVAPGSYEIEAVPTDSADGLVGNPNPTNEIDYFVTIAAATAVCDGNLAFTGGTIGWFGFALAGGMLFLGIAFLYMKRRGNRAAE